MGMVWFRGGASIFIISFLLSETNTAGAKAVNLSSSESQEAPGCRSYAQVVKAQGNKTIIIGKEVGGFSRGAWSSVRLPRGLQRAETSPR